MKIYCRRESVGKMDRVLQTLHAADVTLSHSSRPPPQDKYSNHLGGIAPSYQLKIGGRHFDLTREFSHKGRDTILCSSLAGVASSQQQELKNDAFSNWYSRSTSDPWRNGRIRFRCHGN
ncbi:uncharacterized protein [Macrobrachium rosenbergii]|uniref:uncharacterized protein isoform X1 n=1 Tax=Macrobrachium rosenbergii TaxID=79674 RepID=UPI0034D64CC1